MNRSACFLVLLLGALVASGCADDDSAGTAPSFESDDPSRGAGRAVGGDAWGYAPIAATGDRAVLSLGWRGKLSVVGGADPARPALLHEEQLSGGVIHVTTAGDLGIASLGYDGVQTISLLP